MLKLQKYVKDSLVIKCEILLPNDTNPLNNLMGGKLMHWMDIIAAISAQKFCNKHVVTASVDNISFENPIPLGHVVTLTAKVTRSFTTSMEVHIDVIAEDIPNNTRFNSNSAFFTFVAVDKENKPQQVPESIPETEEEIKLYDGALRRRQLRLVLAGRLKPDEATELKSIFT